MPTPPAYPSELLESEHLAALIASAKERYDFVLFDSPPLMAVTDAAVLASRVDGVVLVIKGETIPRELLCQAMDMLADVKASVVGACSTWSMSVATAPTTILTTILRLDSLYIRNTRHMRLNESVPSALSPHASLRSVYS